ncbi:MAG: hypothetical protein ACC608_09640 [Anaerofustis sp.]
MDWIQTAILSVLITFVGFMIQRGIKKRDANAEKREQQRSDSMMLVVKGVDVSVSLSEATAISLQRGKCNGEVSKALEKTEEYNKEKELYYQKLQAENAISK